MSSATGFVDSIGVNTHLGYRKTGYRDASQVLTRLQELGVHHIRESLPVSPNKALVSGLRQLPSYGLQADLSVAQATKQLPSPARTLKSLDRINRGSVDAVEAPNEWDHAHAQDWLPEIVTFTRQFGQLLHSSPEWGEPSGDPVLYVGPSTGSIGSIAELPDLGSVIDVANLHDYAAGGPPELDLGNLAIARKVAPGKPIWVTELGYHTAVNQDGRQPAVTEAQQGPYLARNLLENYTHGVARSYIYQLLDDRPEPALANQERHFGLLHTDLSPKPSYTLLRNLLTNLSGTAPAAISDSAEVAAGSAAKGASTKQVKQSLSASIETPGDGVGWLLLQRSDHSYGLVLWARGKLNLDGTPAATNATVKVSIAGAERAVSVVRSSGARVSGQTAGVVTEVTGRLGGDPVIVNIAANGTQTSGSRQTTQPTLAFDATGLAPGAATVPHGNVGQLPRRVKNVLVWSFAFLMLAVAVTMSAWARRRRRRQT